MGYPTYSLFASGTAARTTAQTLTVNVPAGTLTGKLMLMVLSSSSYNNDPITTPSGWTLLVAGSINSFSIFGRIGTSSESNPVVTWTNNWSEHHGFIDAYTSSTGWPAIGSCLVDSSIGNGGGNAAIRYRALTVTQEGCLGVQWGTRATNTSGSASAVATTSGYTAAQRSYNSGANSQILASQFMTASPTIASGMAQNDETITGNTDVYVHAGITATFAGAAGSALAYTASTRIDSPYTALPDWLIAQIPNGLQANDTFDLDPAKPAEPAGAGVTLGNSGYVHLTFFYPNPQAIKVYYLFRDDNGTGDKLLSYYVIYPPPDDGPPVVTNLRAAAIASESITIEGAFADDQPPIDIFAIALLDTDPAPTGTTGKAQIIAGTDTFGHYVPRDALSILGSGVVQLTMYGVLPRTRYIVYLVARDSSSSQNITDIKLIYVTTVGVTYPTQADAPFNTEVEPIVTITSDLMDDGSFRVVDTTAKKAYAIHVEHPILSTTQRDNLRVFFTNNSYRLIDIVAADGYTYRCRLVEDPVWSNISGTFVKATITLKGNRV